MTDGVVQADRAMTGGSGEVAEPLIDEGAKAGHGCAFGPVWGWARASAGWRYFRVAVHANWVLSTCFIYCDLFRLLSFGNLTQSGAVWMTPRCNFVL